MATRTVSMSMKGVRGFGALSVCAVGVLSCLSACERSDDDSISTQGSAIKAPPCEVDSDRETGFCDVDACAEPDAAAFPYGAECDEDKQQLGGKLNDPCGAYVCRDGRCRSCVSDDECGEGNSNGPSECHEWQDRPGKGCGVILDADIDLHATPPPQPAGGSPSNGETTTVSPPPPGEGGADAG